MEKQRKSKRNRFVTGLLILFTFTQAFAAPRLTTTEIRELRIKPAQNQKFLTGEEIKFELEIPRTNPKNVEITNPKSEDGITFRTLRRTAGYGQSESTQLELWYEFSTPGEQKPASLEVRINNRNFKIPFETVEIEENPANLKPRMVIKFSNGKSISTFRNNENSEIFSMEATKSINFTIFVQYTTQVIDFKYEIPKNALLDNTRLHEITEVKYREKTYSHALVPVADFEWSPLIIGKTYIPSVSLKVIGYDGSKIDLSTPANFINVLPASKESSSANDDELFADSFEQIELDTSENTSEKFNVTDFEKTVRERKTLYLKCLLICMAVIILAALVLWFLKIKSPLPYLVISLLMVLLLVVFVILSKQKSAVFTGGAINSIPEATAGNHLQINENIPVKIVKETAEWYCIEFDENIGWAKKENVKVY